MKQCYQKVTNGWKEAETPDLTGKTLKTEMMYTENVIVIQKKCIGIYESKFYNKALTIIVKEFPDLFLSVVSEWFHSANANF